MSMEEPHAHMTESTESISAFSVDFCFGFCSLFVVHQFSPYPDISFLVS